MQEESFTLQNKLIVPPYDYIFCGTGASASLLLLQLHQNNLLQNLNILLIDPDIKGKRDKTFCFWADVEETIITDLNPIISHKWDEVVVSGDQIQSIRPLQYNHVSSIELYDKIRELALQYNWEKIIGHVEEVKADQQGPFVILNGSEMRAKYIFDSRPPSYTKAQARETHILQSFVGWMIETEDKINNPTAFRFMDFEIEQNDSTQFVYVLPFSANTALVEVTRFGSEIIDKAEAESILDVYVKKHFGKHTLVDIELGCIPMSNTGINTTQLPGIVMMGARNHQIKPSTGYAFKNMYYHARSIVEAIKQNQPIEALNKSSQEVHKGRFSFYDGLLLDILKNKPKEGKRIFNALLQKVEIKTILNFLDEKTGLASDLSIFRQLPWWVFISTLVQRSFSLTWFRPLLLTLITGLLLLPGNHSAIQNYVAYGFIFTGLVTVGIPHGAVDHLLETGKWNMKVGSLFIIKYLILALCMGLLWNALPVLALVFFLLFSSWHFGQADGKSWFLSKEVSILWGASVLFYILGTHLSETNKILAAMGNLWMPLACPEWFLLPWLVIAVYRKNAAFALTVFWLFLSAYLPLLVSFGLYFIGQHSLTGWQDIRNHIKLSHSRIWLNALPFHAAAWIFLLCFLFFWPSAYPFAETKRWAIFFIFIACISFPHVVSMNVVYKSKE